MGYGLGRDSPVVLSLGKTNYESMLARHGQNVRWIIAKRCTCVLESNHPDPQCDKCGGSGEQYDFQREFTDTIRVRVDHGIAELPEENINAEVLRAYDGLGIEYTPMQMGKYIQFDNPNRKIVNGETIDLVIKQSTVTVIEDAELEYVGNGFYRVPQAVSDRSNIEGVSYLVPGDIIGIDAVFDHKEKKIDIFEYRNNTVRLNDDNAVQPIRAIGIKFIKPYKFFVLSQDLDEEDDAIVRAHGGDAISTFQYRYKVSEGDIITVLSGTNPMKTVIRRRPHGDDVLPDYFVSGVSYLSTSKKEYEEGKDFIIVGANKIHWICKDLPSEGDSISVSYEYLPTYRVHKAIPQLRSSEDQRLPRKVVLELFSAVQESRGINWQRVEA
jgi:Fe-S cluster assembly iron-binding protein IscA